MAKTKTTKAKAEAPVITPLPETEIKLKKEKYWIEPGMAVMHVDYPDLKMRVQNIKKVTKKVYDGKTKDSTVDRTFILGVVTSWIDKDQKFQKGMFSTRDLRPWPKDKA
jgi:hypothetical protein